MFAAMTLILAWENPLVWLWGKVEPFLEAMWRSVREGLLAALRWLWDWMVQAFKEAIDAIVPDALEDGIYNLVSEVGIWVRSFTGYWEIVNLWFPATIGLWLLAGWLVFALAVAAIKQVLRLVPTMHG